MSGVLCRPMVKLMPMGDFWEKQWKLADVFNVLELNDAEIGLLTGIMMMNPGKNSPST